MLLFKKVTFCFKYAFIVKGDFCFSLLISELIVNFDYLPQYNCFKNKIDNLKTKVTAWLFVFFFGVR